MTVRGFIFLMVVAVAASVASGLIVERYTAPGLERTFWFAVLTGLVVFPAGLLAERLGWMRGRLNLTRAGTEHHERSSESAGADK